MNTFQNKILRKNGLWIALLSGAFFVCLLAGKLNAQQSPNMKLYFNEKGEVIGSLNKDNGQMTLISVSPDPSGGGAGVAPRDPDLEDGFPIKMLHREGTYTTGPVINAVIGNLDPGLELEIVVSALAAGPVFAFNHDGSPLLGQWPIEGPGVGYVSLGRLSINTPLNLVDVFIAFHKSVGSTDPYLGAFDGRDGSPLEKWPIKNDFFAFSPATLINVDNVDAVAREHPNYLPEIFVDGQDGRLHAYRYNAVIPSVWPTALVPGGRERHTPAAADIDNDRDLEIVTAEASNNQGGFVYAHHHDGKPVFPPVKIGDGRGLTDVFPVIGDVDNDGKMEIIVVNLRGGAQSKPAIFIISGEGALERAPIELDDEIDGTTAPALADLDNDQIPEIIVQTKNAIHVVKADGTVLLKIPADVTLAAGNSSPVVGDVDEDKSPEIVVTYHEKDSLENGEVHVYNTDGTMHPHFPKKISIGLGAVPAIADIDLDGRNEIIVTGNFWNGQEGDYDKIWAYDLGRNSQGPAFQNRAPEWGQFGGNAAHWGTYYPNFPFLRGDTNTDGKVNLSDSVYLLLHLFQGGSAPSCVKTGDTDDNGKLNITDAIYALIHLFQGGPPIFEPYPEVGIDTTLDDLTCISYDPQ